MAPWPPAIYRGLEAGGDCGRGGRGGRPLLVFLLTDLPDANATGTLDTDQSFIDAEAVPREGFYMELLGGLALTITGIALATMSSAQLLSR